MSGGYAIEGAFLAKMRNAGESCIAANRLYVHDSIYDEFCSRLVERFADLKVGNGLEPDVDVGPTISRKELEKLQAIVAEAVDDGVTVETGGRVLHETGFRPGRRPGWHTGVSGNPVYCHLMVSG